MYGTAFANGYCLVYILHGLTENAAERTRRLKIRRPEVKHGGGATKRVRPCRGCASCNSRQHAAVRTYTTEQCMQSSIC